jgi:hypothetical protein
VESEKNRFTIIPKGKQTEAIDLELDPFIQHGHVIEVAGKTQIGARVMVNGREVPMISTDGTFHYFTPPLATGESSDYGDSADRAGRSEYAAEEDHYSVGGGRVSGAVVIKEASQTREYLHRKERDASRGSTGSFGGQRPPASG